MSEVARRRRVGGSSRATGVKDAVEVRIFTIADHATVTPLDGKLYIHGAGVGGMLARAFPANIPPLWLAIRFKVPWHMTSDKFPIKVRVLDADRNPVGPDVLQGNGEIGRPPGVRPGDEIAVNAVIGLAGYPVKAAGTIYFHLLVGDQTLSVLPFKVDQVPEALAPRRHIRRRPDRVIPDVGVSRCGVGL